MDQDPKVPQLFSVDEFIYVIVGLGWPQYPPLVVYGRIPAGPSQGIRYFRFVSVGYV